MSFAFFPAKIPKAYISLSTFKTMLTCWYFLYCILLWSHLWELRANFFFGNSYISILCIINVFSCPCPIHKTFICAVQSFIAILDFSLLLLVKLSLLIFFASFLVGVLCFFFDGSLSLSKVIALPTIAIVVALSFS